MKKITKLTKKQEQEFPLLMERWLKFASGETDIKACRLLSEAKKAKTSLSECIRQKSLRSRRSLFFGG
jgi:hypothetical protein